MARINIVFLMLTAGLVSACGDAKMTSHKAFSEPAPLIRTVNLVPGEYQPNQNPLLGVTVQDITVRVPETLRVSEANSYLPRGDIVWRGDPIGDRYAQVKAIFETALRMGTKAMDGTRPIALDVVVKRFHALTEKARYSVGGVHSITFDLTLRDSVTGAILSPTREIRANLNAYGGQRAIEADLRGLTQKVRITAHLARVIQQELTAQGEFQTSSSRLGLVQEMAKR